MKYGYFDNKAREYIVTSPDTPRPWTNYSGNRNYNTIMTANAGGYSYYRSSAYGRFLRQQFTGIPIDCPGRYFYLRDAESNDFWSASWQPVAKDLADYKTHTRFGSQYTIIESEYRGIKTESTYFVPMGKDFEYWVLKVTNTDSKPRTLDIFTYCEFTNQWNIFEDKLDLQYSTFIGHGTVKENMLHFRYHENMPAQNDSPVGSVPCSVWMSLIGAPVVGFDTNRESFLGAHHGYHNPAVVQSGSSTNSEAYGNNACGSLHTRVTLKAGQSAEMVVLLGIGAPDKEGKTAVAEYGSVTNAKAALAELVQHWHSLFDAMTVQTPDDNFNCMVNTWNPYCAYMNFFMSRSASLTYTGDSRDGLGFRDSVQDVLGITHMAPDQARERLVLMLSGQESIGAAKPEIKPFTHKPGSMPVTPIEQIRSDDCYWFFNAIPAYVNETGDVGFYDLVVPYSDKGQDTVLGHLRRAIEFTFNNVGAHGLPAGLKADWNDSVVLGRKGETVFVAMQWRFALAVYADISRSMGRASEVSWAEGNLKTVDELIQKHTWDGEWFVRGWRENGSVIGSKSCAEGTVWLNPQLWAVIGGAATPKQAETAMESVHKLLASDVGLIICEPPFVKTDPKEIKSVVFMPGFKENAGIYNHNQGWGVIAECIMGHGDRAWEYYRAAMPATYNERAEVRKCEPYVHCQTTATRVTPVEGEGNVAWLSGTASWMAFSATHYILGIRPQVAGLLIDPCVPAAWKKFTVERIVRGKRLSITVENPAGVQKGVKRVVVNGKEIAGGLIPEELLVNNAKISAIMG